jgi:DNA-binding transcriptional ArsR family regulator
MVAGGAPPERDSTIDDMVAAIEALQMVSVIAEDRVLTRSGAKPQPPQEIVVIRQLCRHVPGGLTADQLARNSGLPLPRIRQVLTRLARAEIVVVERRARPDADVYHAAESSRKYRAEIAAQLANSLAYSFATLPEEQREALVLALPALHALTKALVRR